MSCLRLSGIMGVWDDGLSLEMQELIVSLEQTILQMRQKEHKKLAGPGNEPAFLVILQAFR